MAVLSTHGHMHGSREGTQVTRRQAARVLLAGAIGNSACSTNREIFAQLGEICKSGDFAIIGARLGLDSAKDLVPAAITVMGNDAGQLELLGGPRQPHVLSLAPDGGWVAWVPESYLPNSFSQGGQPIFCLTDDPRFARNVRYHGWYCIQLAVSAHATHLALIAMEGGPQRASCRLLVINPTNGETIADLTPLVKNLDLVNAERLRLSASGLRLAVGARGSFAVIDLAANTILLAGEGRFPTLSPSGEELAFVDRRRNLILVTLATGAARNMLKGIRARGVGSWVPGSRLVFACVTPPLAFLWHLVVVDSASGAYTKITSVEEWNLGDKAALIKRRLLSPNLKTGR